MKCFVNPARLWRVVCCVLIVGLRVPHAAWAEGDAKLEKEFQSSIRPLFQKYCHDCHAGDVTEAEIDLKAFGTLAEVRKDSKTWVKVRQILDTGQMPPKDALKPTDEEFAKLKTWVREFLTAEAKARAGDPGPVVLRRLSNAEYNYTIRDLTGLESLDPTREFPIDGAAGEGFTNTGSGQGMSPALLQKYLDAAKEVSGHAVLLPDGIRFSPFTTPRDQTDELLAKIQAFYRQYTEDGEGMPVNLQGIQFNTNQGGLLPLASYLTATIAERDLLLSGQKTLEQVAQERSLNVKYLGLLWKELTKAEPASFFMQAFRAKWQKAKPGDVPALLKDLSLAQTSLWKFNSVGHIGRQGSPKSWMEPVSPIKHEQELRIPIPAPSEGKMITLYLSASDLGDGNAQDFVVFKEPRIEILVSEFDPPQSMPLKDVRTLAGKIEQTLADELPRTGDYLTAVTELKDSKEPIEPLAKSRGLNADLLSRWIKLINLNQKFSREIEGRFTEKHEKVQGHEAINGWGHAETPSMLTNRSEQPISFSTLTVPARGVVVHPSPALESLIAWKSPIQGQVKLNGLIADADNKCGNGAAWRVELHSESGRQILASGTIDSGKTENFAPLGDIQIGIGDVILLFVNARDQNHVCDTTHVELTITETEGQKRVWDLARDVVDNILDGNPLPDTFGNKEIWHFGALPSATEDTPTIPLDSALAHWRQSVIEKGADKDIEVFAKEVQDALTEANPKTLSAADQTLRRQLLAWRGPLDWVTVSQAAQAAKEYAYGLDPQVFGKHPQGERLAESDLCLKAPGVFEVKLPLELVAGSEFVVTAHLHESTGKKGSIQVRSSLERPEPNAISLAAPVLLHKDSEIRDRVETELKEFRELFPPALCYARIVPVDEVVTLTLFYREDDHLRRLMLDEKQAAELDRLWEELFYVSQEPLKTVVALEQISEFATQDRPDLVDAFAPMRMPIAERAKAFRERMAKAEPVQVESLVQFAGRAWRRPLNETEKQKLREFYETLRREDISHEETIRLLLARVLTAPAFLYKLEHPALGTKAAPVSQLELASRLSYFLWSSLPDDKLRQTAEAGLLSDQKTLLAETKRMLKDAKSERLALQFACQWLNVRDFDQNDDKNEAIFPEFADLKDDMHQETVRFFADMIQNDGAVLGILNADHTLLNDALAKHYGIKDIQGPMWRRVENIKAQGRGGVLGMATFLASQSGASRTSAILRGNWVYETLLGERLPRPPANVPVLPDDVPEGLTERQLIERHSSDPACAKCHVEIDPYGFSLEQFDAIGRLRPQKMDTKTTLPGGQTIDGLNGLREYLLEERQDDVIRQFCRKLLGFALGRELQLSDEPLLDEMHVKLRANDFRFHTAIETIVASKQFQTIRGRETNDE